MAEQARQGATGDVDKGMGENPRATLQEVPNRLAALRLDPTQGGTRRWTSIARIVSKGSFAGEGEILR